MCTLEVAATPATIDAHLTVDGRPNGRVRDMIAVPCTAAMGASQLHAGRLSLLLLQVEGFLQPKLQRVSAVGERPVRDTLDVVFHEGDRFRVSEIRNQKITLHLHDLLMTERTR